MKKHVLFRLMALLLAIFLLVGCGTVSSPAEPDTENIETPPVPTTDITGKYQLAENGEAVISDVDMTHYAAATDNNRVFYEIFVGSFSDSDGDGIGDLQGIIDRMDYLNDGDPKSGLSLGVEGIWLTPVFTSGSYHKYDVNDYYTIDPQFGTMQDLQALIDLCHERDVKIIIDLPINHTGNRNPMFNEFVMAHRAEDTENPYYNYYSYYKAGETAPAGRSFAQVAGTDTYYECNFSTEMPELDFDNEAVRTEVVNIAKFYLDMGIDGFRFDAAKYIYFGDNQRSVDFWVWYMEQLRQIKPDLYAVAEVWDGDGITDQYYKALDCFNFTTSQANGMIAECAKAGNVNRYTAYVQQYMETVRAANPDAIMMPFISNHDMDRAAGFLMAANGHAQMAANLYILNTGSPFIYYGEEIGIRGSRGGAQTDANRRLAMLWGDDDTVKNPEGSSYPASSQLDSSVAAQLGDGNQLYNYYKRLLMIRAANPEIARGEYTALSLGDKMGGFTATWQGSTVCVLHNTTTRTISVDMTKLGDFAAITASIGLDTATLEGTTLTVGPQTSVVLR